MKISSYAKTGIAVLTVGAALYWGMNFLKGINVFSPENTYSVLYERIDGLGLSNPVEIRGLKVGQVRDIRFSDKMYGSVLVTISTRGDLRIPKGTVARIFSSDLMGSKSIELIMGGHADFYAPGDTLMPDMEGSIGDQVKLQMLPLKHKAEDLMVSMEQAITAVQYVFNEQTGVKLQASLSKVSLTIDALRHSAANLDTIMDESKWKITKTLSNIESITKNIDENKANINSILVNMGSISDSISKSNLTQTLNNLGEAIEEANMALEKINSGSGSLGKLIYDDSLYTGLSSTLESLDALLIDVKGHPKKYVHFSLFGKADK
jgi:phospholipid/cholesterol/gamma-HCH transport system substrate-binding protein